MALPDNESGTNLHWAPYKPPTDRYRGKLQDFEKGPIALSDPSQGIDYQVWSLEYIDDQDADNYGDFIITPETVGAPLIIHNEPYVTQVGLAFDQNGYPFICYLKQCQAYYRWYDFTVAGDYVIEALDPGVTSVACCLDDHRDGQVDAGASDVILAYTLSGSLWYRQERERYDTARELVPVAGQPGVGTGFINRIGMNEVLRLQWDGGNGNGEYISDLVGLLLTRVGLKPIEMDLTEIDQLLFRGWKSAGHYNAADALKAICSLYFFDLVKVDKKLVAIRRGGEPVATISQADLVEGAEFWFKDAREQGLEFPVKFNLAYAGAENDYTPTKAPSERRSRDIKSVTEGGVDSAFNHTPQDAGERADIIHKVMWANYEGRANFTLPGSYAPLFTSNVITLEVREGTFKRMLLTKVTTVDSVIECEAVIDRQSAYSAGAITIPGTIPAEAPLPTIPGDTTWQFMDLPALLDTHDNALRYYVAGRGDAGTAWYGAVLQRQLGSDWVKETDVGFAEVMGTLQEALPASPAEWIDTTNTVLVSLNVAPTAYTTELVLAGKGAWAFWGGSGWEIICIRDWVAEGANWRGSWLLRGRKRTAPVSYSIGAPVVFLGNTIDVQVLQEFLDTTLTLRAVSYDQAPSDAASSAHLFQGKSHEEWAPVQLSAQQAGSAWELSWVPSYSLGHSANPVPSAHFYGWRIRFTVGSVVDEKVIESTTPSYTYSAADQTSAFGSPQSSFDNVEIRALNRLGGDGQALNEGVS